MNILIIDDEPNIRATLSDLLEMNGYKVTCASNGAEGLAYARNAALGCIITDIRMPVMDGYAFIEACRRDPRLQRVPIIVASGNDMRTDVRRAMDAGADDYISKPFTEVEVVRSVKARMEKKDLIDELDAFAHTAAHDLKSPLGTLSVRLELVARAVQQGQREPALKHLQNASASAEQLSAIIDELLLLAGVRHQSVEVECVDMQALLGEAMDRVSALLTKTEAAVTLPSEWPLVAGHGPWLVHVWTNLLANAAKYAGPRAQITIGSEVLLGGQRVRYWVQDRGPGLSAEACQQMFTPFTRLSKIRAKGNGLGLSIVRRIIEKMKGSVGVESAEGQGSRFWFELPTAVPPAEAPPPVPPCIIS